MSRTRQAIVAFWVVIIGLLIWQFYDYHTTTVQAEVAHPQQQHFFFYKTNTPPVSPGALAHRDGADVEQTNFEVQPDTPSAGMFTCRVTVKNVGKAKAVGVQVDVRPYKGIALGDLDNGHARPGTLIDSDPIAQIGQWVSFPDLDPDASATETAIFIVRHDVSPGTNPQPEILFDTEKAKADKPPASLQTPPSHRAPSD